MIKRTTGPKAKQDDASLEGKTLTEKLAATQPQDEKDQGEDLVGTHPAVTADDDVDAIVRAAKAMRDINETRQSQLKLCLIVDDSRVIRKVSSKIAVSMGYQVIEAENGAEALTRCQQRMPELVLTDWQMPVMSGIEFVTALRAIPTPRAPTVIFCTSKGEASDIHEGIAAGADDYVIKPFDETALRTKLERIGVG